MSPLLILSPNLGTPENARETLHFLPIQAPQEGSDD